MATAAPPERSSTPLIERPPTLRVQVNIYVHPDVHRLLRRIARKNETTLASTLERVIRADAELHGITLADEERT